MRHIESVAEIMVRVLVVVKLTNRKEEFTELLDGNPNNKSVNRGMGKAREREGT